MKTKREVDRRFRKGIPLKRIWYYRQLGMSFSEIGRLCNCSKQSAWMRLMRFRRNKLLYDELTKKWFENILEKSSPTCRLP